MDEEEQTLNRTRRAKIIMPVIIILVILGLIFIGWTQYRNFCNSPVRYSLGDVDPRFKLSSDEIIRTLQDSEKRWDSATNENAFEYDPSSNLKINLIYDQRQADLDELKSAVGVLNNQNQSLEDWNKSLKQMIQAYDKDLQDYNSRVTYWNSQGGAPTETFSALEVERRNLDKRRNEINKTAELLNIQVSKYNLSVDQIKNEADQNKNQLITQGMYFSKENKIDIYTFGNKEELRLVLMHELGHARGVDHATSDLSIMYSVLGNQNLDDPIPSNEDVNLIKNSCVPRALNSLISKSAF